MTHAGSFPSPKQSRNLLDEADIGSGEKTAAERETEELIKQIPALESPDDEQNNEQNIENDADIDQDAQQDALDIENFLEDGSLVNRIEQEHSLDKDEPNSGLDELDPVPPKGD